ncbi:tonB-dependent heme receptor A [Wolffia australiana]
MAMAHKLRSAIKLSASAESAISGSVSRSIHSTGLRGMGGGHGHGHGSEPYYLHAKHMYNLHRMKHQGLKMSLGVLSAFSIGVAVPIVAVIFQQKKRASG